MFTLILPPPFFNWFNAPVKFKTSIKENPSALILLPIPMADICLAPLKEFAFNRPAYRPSVPAPALIFPNMPFFLSFFSFRLIVFSLLPSSNPVNWAWSLSLSYTWTLSTASAGRFLVAIFGSLPKNSFPSTKTFCTFSPWAFTVPSFSTFTPGNFFKRSSTFAFGCVLNEPALYWIVSPTRVTGGASDITTTSLNTLLRSYINTFPRSIFLCSSSTLKNWVELW